MRIPRSPLYQLGIETHGASFGSYIAEATSRMGLLRLSESKPQSTGCTYSYILEERGTAGHVVIVIACPLFKRAELPKELPKEYVS